MTRCFLLDPSEYLGMTVTFQNALHVGGRQSLVRDPSGHRACADEGGAGSPYKMPRPSVPTYTRPKTRGSPAMQRKRVPYWCWSSFTRSHVLPASSDRQMALSLSRVPMANSAG